MKNFTSTVGLVAAAAALAILSAGHEPAAAQTIVVASCPSASPFAGAGQRGLPYAIDVNGNVCTTGGGAATVADGADVAQGTTTDAACSTDNGTCTEISLLKRIAQRITTLYTSVVLQAGSAIIGKVGIDQTTPGTTNLVAAGQTGTWTVQPGNTANTTAWLFTGSGAAGTPAAGVVTVQGAASMTPLQVSQGAAATGGYSFLNIAAGQATTVIKASAGTLHSIVLNSAATATNTTIVYDHPSGVGTVIGRPAVTTATVPTTLIYDLAFANGLTIITANANGGDMTVVYK